MSRILTVCREHGHAPAWWDSLDSETQGLLLADLEKRTPKPKAKAR
jgi:hypothetical protein